jgi:hypothetical protein
MYSRVSALIMPGNRRPRSVTCRIVFRPGAEDDLFALYRSVAEASSPARAEAIAFRVLDQVVEIVAIAYAGISKVSCRTRDAV